MLAALLLAAFAAEQIPTPRTVNDGVLGTAHEFAVDGPARVCLLSTSFDLEEGETAYLAYLGIHFGEIRVVGPRGTINLREGDSWTEPTGGEVVQRSPDRAIARYGQGRAARYLLYLSGEPVMWVQGSALRGPGGERRVLPRIRRLEGNERSCTRRFIYGLNFIDADED
jgi:hypothetical protein